MNGLELKKLRIERGLTQQELFEATGIPQGSIARMETSGEDIKKVDNLIKLKKFFKIEDGILKDVDFPYAKSKPRSAGIPVYADSEQDNPAFEVYIPQLKDCDFGKIIHDNAMAPAYPAGCYAFLKSVVDKKNIVYGSVYYVEFDNYQVLRRLKKGDKEGELLAIADNMELDTDSTKRYQSFSIPVKSISKIFLSKGMIRLN